MSRLDEILTLLDLSNLPPKDALRVIAELIDLAFDNQDLFATATALKWCEALEPRLIDASQRAELDYFRSNAWSHRQSAANLTEEAKWGWEQQEASRQVFFLRRSLSQSMAAKGVDFRRCQALTNLANQLDTVGRTVAAQRSFSKALQELPRFWMARGNRGRALMSYAGALYDPGHRASFAAIAHRELTSAIEHIRRHPSFGEPRMSSFYEAAARQIEERVDVDAIVAHLKEATDLGSDDTEQAYRNWCLQETLFLNPLNDLGALPIAARDVLLLPDFRVKVGEGPVLIGFFNQLKQEFASARWLLYEGLQAEEAHLADRQVLTLNTLDFSALGLALEKVKIAFRMAYSLLDKVAYFLNHYLGLGIPEKRVSFRTIWRDKDNSPIRSQLEDSRNWPLRGLYWLSRDLFEAQFKDVMDPEAKELAELRNHLEHKYVKVQWHSLPVDPFGTAATDIFKDNLAHSISQPDLERRALHVMRMAREALIYLSLGMHAEEKRREAESPSTGLVMPMNLEAVDDVEKRRI